MSRFRLKLNGWDASSAFNKWGVSYQPIKVEGANSGVSQNGSTIVDVVKTKDLLTLQGNGVDASTFARLSTLARLGYVTAVYPHPETGTDVTKVMMPRLSPAIRTPVRAGEVWYEGWTLTLEER